MTWSRSHGMFSPKLAQTPVWRRTVATRTNKSRSGTRKPTKRPYESTLRQAQAEQTREQIVAAAYESLQVVPVHELSYAALAQTLDISPRTIYRHFPDKSDLAQAVVRKHIERVRGPASDLPRTLREAAALLRRMHQLLEKEPGTYRLFFHVPVRSQGGVQRFVEAVWADVLSRLPERDRPAAAGLFELFMGPYAYDVLHGNWGLSAVETTRVCLAALDLIAEGLERDPTALSPTRPTPARFSGPLSDDE
jgi:AcrR family transcriptional regulator